MFSPAFAGTPRAAPQNNYSKEQNMVYVFLAEGFEEVEALTPVDLMRRAGIDVTTVGVGGKVICGAHGIPVTADITDGELPRDPADLSMVVLPGGMPGTKNLDASPAVDAYLRLAAEKGAYIAAICAAPMVLGKRDLLLGKRATCYPGFEETLAGATLAEGSAVVTDGLYITAKAAGYAAEFAYALITALAGDAEEVRAAICP